MKLDTPFLNLFFKPCVVYLTHGFRMSKKTIQFIIPELAHCFVSIRVLYIKWKASCNRISFTSKHSHIIHFYKSEAKDDVRMMLNSRGFPKNFNLNF